MNEEKVKIRLKKAEVVNGSVYPEGAVVDTDLKTAKRKVLTGVAEVVKAPSMPTPPPSPPHQTPQKDAGHESTDGEGSKKGKKEK